MWIWFGLAVLALIGELGTGTFYLLVASLGLAAGGVAAWLSLDIEWQLLACIAALMAALVVLRKTGVLKKRGLDPQRNADANLDIGQQVDVTAWQPDGTAKVWHRGANWQALLAEGQPAQAGAHIITEIRNNRLVLSPRRP